MGSVLEAAIAQAVLWLFGELRRTRVDRAAGLANPSVMVVLVVVKTRTLGAAFQSHF